MRVNLWAILIFAFLFSFSAYAEKSEGGTFKKPVKGMASGVKTVGSGAGKFVKETVKGAKEGPVDGTVQGVQKGTGELVDSTIKGTYKVATLGYGNVDRVDLEAPPAYRGELDPSEKDPAKFKIKF